MAYASGTPRSWTTGELVTASYMNGIRDALNELSGAILTTAGDMLYASSGTVRARLAIGATNAVMQVVSGAPAWVAAPVLSGHLTFTADSTYDIGASGATRPRTAYLSTSLQIGNTPATAGEVRLKNDFTLMARNASNSANGQLLNFNTSNIFHVGDPVNISSMVLNANSNVDVNINNVKKISIGNGLQVGTPSGGDKGTGTINAQIDVYKNNSAYTNPDYAFEHAFTGKIERFADRDGAASYEGLIPLARVEAFAREHLHLPRVSRDPMGMFERGDVLLEKLEEVYLYLFEINRQLRAAGMAGV